MQAKRKLDKQKLIKKSAGPTSRKVLDVVDQAAVVKSLGDNINTRMQEIEFDDELDVDFDDRTKKLQDEAALMFGTGHRNLDSVVASIISSAAAAAPLFVAHNRNSITCSAVVENIVVYGDKSGTVYLYDTLQHKKSFLSPPVGGSVLSIAVSDTRAVQHQMQMGLERTTVDHSCPSFVAAGGTDGSIHVWKTFSQEYVGSLKLHRSAVTGLTFRHLTSTLYSCSTDSTVRVWSVAEMLAVDRLFGHLGGVNGISALRKERAATAGGDRTARYWKIEAGTQVEYQEQAEPVECVVLLNEETIATGSTDGSLSVFDTGKLKPICTQTGAHGSGEIGDGTGLEKEFLTQSVALRPPGIRLRVNNPIYCIASPPYSGVIATGSHDGFVRLWKYSGGGKAHSANTRTTSNNQLTAAQGTAAEIVSIGAIAVEGVVSSLTFSEDGTTLYVASGKEPRLGRWVTMAGVLNGIRIFSVSGGVSQPSKVQRDVAASIVAPRLTRQQPRVAEQLVAEPTPVDIAEPNDDDDADELQDETLFRVGENGQLVFDAPKAKSDGGKPLRAGGKAKKRANKKTLAPPTKKSSSKSSSKKPKKVVSH